MATKSITKKFRIDPETWEAFNLACEENGTYPSEVLRTYCRQYSFEFDAQPKEMLSTSPSTSQLAFQLPEATNDRSLEVVINRVGELYCGPGGIGLGAAQAVVEYQGKSLITEPLWANDFDPDTCKTWERNVVGYEREKKNLSRDVKIHCGDVRELDLQNLAPVDGLMFGFPCNDFSIVGEHKGFDGEYGPLYSYGVRVLRLNHSPNWFIAENVGGITSSNDGKAFEVILQDFRDSGYRITAHKYKLEEYGVPQARHRVIIVGFREDLGLEFKVPAPTQRRKNAGEALANIPQWAKNNELTRQSKEVVERLSYIAPGENAWNAKRLPDHLKLNVPRTQLSHIYKKLHPEQPAYTVTGSGGGGTHMYHWSENRALTNRERARLQTFPDWFEFVGSKESVRKQIGMAIPVDGARIIVEAVLKTVAGMPYSYVHPNIGH